MRKPVNWEKRFREASRKPKTTFGGDNPTPSAVQQKLNELGASPPLTVDGNIGALSIVAIQAFQQANGLTVDGIAGPQTLSAMGFAGATGILGTSGVAGPSATVTGQVVLPDKSTPLTPEQAAQAFNAAYQKVTGKTPTPNILNLLLSQSAFETENWGHGIHNYNFGNAKATARDKWIQYFRCSEIVNGVETFYDPPSPVCRFAAYRNATEGAVAYINLLKGRSNWWNGLQTGDVSSFVSGLASPPVFFTGDPNKYSAGVSRYFGQYLATAQKYAVPVGVGIVSIITGLGAVAGLGYLARKKGWV